MHLERDEGRLVAARRTSDGEQAIALFSQVARLQQERRLVKAASLDGMKLHFPPMVFRSFHAP